MNNMDYAYIGFLVIISLFVWFMIWKKAKQLGLPLFPWEYDDDGNPKVK